MNRKYKGASSELERHPRTRIVFDKYKYTTFKDVCHVVALKRRHQMQRLRPTYRQEANQTHTPSAFRVAFRDRRFWRRWRSEGRTSCKISHIAVYYSKCMQLQRDVLSRLGRPTKAHGIDRCKLRRNKPSARRKNGMAVSSTAQGAFGSKISCAVKHSRPIIFIKTCGYMVARSLWRVTSLGPRVSKNTLRWKQGHFKSSCIQLVNTN